MEDQMPTPEPDRRARTPLNGKTIDLGRLATEVGVALTSSDTEVVVADADSTVTTAQLQAALAAHVPPTPAADPIDALLVEVGKATTVATVKAALVKGLPAAIRGR